MEDKICLDTDFLINLLRGKEKEKEFTLVYEKSCVFATTYINLFELYLGACIRHNKKELSLIEELSHRIKVLNLSREAVKIAAEDFVKLKNEGLEIEYRDVLIAAITKTEHFCLKTNNIKHFQRIPNLIIKN